MKERFVALIDRVFRWWSGVGRRLAIGLALLLVACGTEDGGDLTATPGPRAPTGVPSSPTAEASETATETPLILTPLTDLGPGTYQGFQGGLYPGGVNQPPADHDRTGQQRAAAVAPRDTQGNIAPDGKVVLLAIGTANGAEVFCGSGLGDCQPWTFGGQAAETAGVAYDHLALVNGAIYGRSTADWDSADDANYDFIRDDALSPQGLSEAQVQVVWLEAANPAQPGEPLLPDPQAGAFLLLESLGDIVRSLSERYPFLQQVFLSSRGYAGYSADQALGEPYAYESGFAVKWLIEAQIRQSAGGRDPLDRRAGDVRVSRGAPWLAWGPYWWADGINPRGDGLAWAREEFEGDGLRPSEAGESKAGRILLDFFSQSAYTQPWFTGEEPIFVQAPTAVPETSTRPDRGQGQGPTAVPEVEITAVSPVPGATDTPQPQGDLVTPTPPTSPGGDNAAVPLIDMGAATYYGFEGGLYPGRQNVMPLQHALAGLERIERLEPLDVNGLPSPEGKIVMLSVGMSNVAREFCGNPFDCNSWSFVGQASADPAIQGAPLVLLNGARSGQDSRDWEQPSASQYGFLRNQVFGPMGLSAAQVQVVWMKHANGDAREYPGLPDPNADAFVLLRRMGNIVRSLKANYPNLQMIFVSSRTYAGYASELQLNPEPYAYESGFAVKWLIEAQIEQMATGTVNQITGDLNYNGSAPWLAWGPYLWANGANPNSDGLAWLQSDFGADGTHPSIAGNSKVASLLLGFFKNSPLTACWFLVDGACGVPAGAR